MFHFKKFSIDDSTAAMKIGTDSVLLGAWTPCEDETRILDIGSGSGILALMMAQKNLKTEIDAIEIEPDAADLARKNVQVSPWGGQIHVFNSSIQDFSVKTNNKYSLVISNPPFFTDSLKAPGKARNIARHNDTLPVRDLLKITSQLLTVGGKAAFIIPDDAFRNWIIEASNQSLFPAYITKVKSSPLHSPHRVMVLFTNEINLEISNTELNIYSSTGIYTTEYRELTKEFYLNF
ncbi:MAG: methyltransferase [Bacteroidales bacterium]|nr:methyltransferase [Bacteroidales bacterium]